jgi:hypothetical protein
LKLVFTSRVKNDPIWIGACMPFALLSDGMCESLGQCAFNLNSALHHYFSETEKEVLVLFCGGNRPAIRT